MQLHGQPTVRLIPAVVLEPRIRLVDGDSLIEGPAFDLDALRTEMEQPNGYTRAIPAMRAKIMASFDASRGRDNRFNAAGDERGVYYAGTSLPSAIEEIRWHLEHDRSPVPFDRTRVYRAVTARVDGRFLDLRGTRAKALNPDVSIGYPAGKALADRVRDRCDGIIYPSARHPLGTCLAVFNPDSLKDVRLDRFLSFERSPTDHARFGYRMHMQPREIARRAAMQLEHA